MYREQDGHYSLDLDEDIGALKRAKDRESQYRKDAETKLRELQKQLEQGAEVDAKKRGDIELLEKSWNAKHEELFSKYNGLKSQIANNLRDEAARALATKVSTVPSVMQALIKERISVSTEDEFPSVAYINARGKTCSLEELQKEIYSTKEFAPILIGSKANGGSATVEVKPSDSSAKQNLTAMSSRELADYIKAKREGI